MTIKNLKKSNGFAASDGLIAVLIIVLFAGIITTIIYNIYLSNASIKRMSTATGYITTIFENMDKTYYEATTVTGLETYINANRQLFGLPDNQIIISSDSDDVDEQERTIGNSDSEDSPYIINMQIDYYSKPVGDGEDEKLDLVKKLTVTVSYKLGNKNQEITMSRVKARETLVTPNTPDISLLGIQEENIYHIKKVNDKWQVCDEKDYNWYNYESGYWATVIVSEEELQIGNEINIKDFADAGKMHVWIPRFAYNGTNIKFLYSNTNNYISELEGYNVLKVLEEGFTVSEEFSVDGKEMVGIWVDNNSGTAYGHLNSVYERQV